MTLNTGNSETCITFLYRELERATVHVDSIIYLILHVLVSASINKQMDYFVMTFITGKYQSCTTILHKREDILLTIVNSERETERKRERERERVRESGA